MCFLMSIGAPRMDVAILFILTVFLQAWSASVPPSLSELFEADTEGTNEEAEMIAMMAAAQVARDKEPPPTKNPWWELVREEGSLPRADTHELAPLWPPTPAPTPAPAPAPQDGNPRDLTEWLSRGQQDVELMKAVAPVATAEQDPENPVNEWLIQTWKCFCKKLRSAYQKVSRDVCQFANVFG